MPLTTTKKMLEDAQKGGYAVGAFNAENMEMLQAIVEAAVQMQSPVMIQTTPSTVRYGSLELFAGCAAALAGRAPVPVALHLDHGDSHDLAVSAIGAGYTSVMIDGSKEGFEENICLTAGVTAAAREKGIPVEAELGTVGGKEDDLESEGGGYTDPAQAAEFAERTGIHSLAVAIGTAHGLYQGIPKLDIGRLEQIRAVVSIPLVLHGASGLADADIRACIARGICKVNFATELRIAYSDGVKAVLAETPGVYDPKTYGAAGRERVKQLVMNRIEVCGCGHQAG